MPTDVQVSLQGVGGLPTDRYVNTLHFEGDDWNVARCDELWSKYEQLITDGVLGGIATGPHRIACYAPGPNPSGPYVAKDYTRAVEITDSGPAEVAICLSYASVDDPEASTPRRRGRIYLGPLSPSRTGVKRPSGPTREQVLNFGEGIAQVGTGTTTTWSLLSRMDGSYHKIESIWVDDAWDTQRRRGAKPTLRQVRDVQ